MPSTSSIFVVEFKYFLAIAFPVALSDITSFFIVYNLPLTTLFSTVVLIDSFVVSVDSSFVELLVTLLFIDSLFESGIVGSSFELINLRLSLSKVTPKLTVWPIALTYIPIVIFAFTFGTSTVNSTVSLSITFLVKLTDLLLTFIVILLIKLYEDILKVT